ncbi:MAG: FAD-dependent oxidoreductase [Tannerella sp.]|jgi:hypothetical protein|nr:FAD-dependent oxidoreductase [Tannerella sp.]
MKKLLSVLFLSCSLISYSKTQKVDICVYGGTASGVITAYSAAQLGKSVILIEPGKYLGGMTTGGLGWTDFGNKGVVTGLSKLFYQRIGKHYDKEEQWVFPPSVATEEINRFIKDANIKVVYQRRVVKVSKSGTAIKSIFLESSTGDKSLFKVDAKQFIDCTYEGDLMAKAGVSYFYGREDNKDFEETLSGFQIRQHHQFPDSIDPYKVKGDPSSGLLWGISNKQAADTGSGDKSIQAYNFRLCLTDDPAIKRDFERPEGYDSTHYELFLRVIEKMPPEAKKFLKIDKFDVCPKFDINNNGPFSTDMIGMNHDYPAADYETREKIWNDHVSYTKGLLYFFSHDERVPQKLREQFNALGWAKDEFVDNDNFPTQLYIREARRLDGEYVMTQHNCQGKKVVDDGIGMAAYGMDSHNCNRLVVNGMVKNEGDVQVGGFSPYPISYRSITPKKTECTNLLVPVCVSSTHIAYGSIRMEPVFMVLGQSAAVAASLAIDKNVAVQKIDVAEIKNILLKNPLLE